MLGNLRSWGWGEIAQRRSRPIPEQQQNPTEETEIVKETKVQVPEGDSSVGAEPVMGQQQNPPEGTETVEEIIVPENEDIEISTNDDLKTQITTLNTKLTAQENYKKASLGIGLGMAALKVAGMIFGKD